MSWAEVKHALNSTLGENGFSSLDKMIRGGVKEFTEDGIFIVPDGVYKILITACAGGGNGDYDSSSNGFRAGGQGGEYIYRKAFNATPKQSISFTIGKGGSPGGNTVIGNLITLLGGGVSGCTGALGGACNIKIISDDNSSSKERFVIVENGQSTPCAIGGRTIGRDSSYAFGLGGGGASLGNGASYTQDFFSTETNNIIAPGYGGGGCGSTYEYDIVAGNGIVIFEW